MKLTDETALRRRLHEELDLADIGLAPVDAVFRRHRAVKARRLGAIASCMAVIATLGLLEVSTAGGHSRVPPRNSSPANLGTTSHPPPPPAGGGVFAAGTANGSRWRLAAVSLADPGYGCLPAVVLNGQNGDLLQPGFLRGLPLGNVAFLAVNPGRPGIGFAFLQLRPGVSRVTADLGDGTRLGLQPITVTVCGQLVRLAGFVYPRQGVRLITARSVGGRRIEYAPLPDIFNPSSNFQSGTWFNMEGAVGSVASGDIGSGSIGGTPWRMHVTLGPDGECFASTIGPAGSVGGASICRPVGGAPRNASFAPLPYARPAGVVIWYPGTVNARTAYLRARLSNGTTTTLVPVVVGGRKYAVLGVGPGVRVTRLTLYDSHGHVLAEMSSFPGRQ